MVKAESGCALTAIACKVHLDRVDKNYVLVILSLLELLFAASLAILSFHKAHCTCNVLLSHLASSLHPQAAV